MPATAQINFAQSLIVQLLTDKELLSAKQVDKLQELQAKHSQPLEVVLVGSGFVSDRDIAAAYSEHLFLPLFETDRSLADVDRGLAQLLPEKLCRDLLIAPVALVGKTLEVVFATPNELLMVDEVQLRTGYHVRPLIGSLSVVEEIIGTLYGGVEWSSKGFAAGTEGFEEVKDAEDGGDDDSADGGASEVIHLDQPTAPGRDGRIIRLVNQILAQALHEGASDVHLEPFEDECKVRIRIDGRLTDIASPPRSLFVPIVSRLKVLAKLDIAEKRVPQDGAIALRTESKRVDLRVSTVPTVNGEKVVLRVLDKGAIPCQLGQLGMDPRQTEDLTNTLNMPHGLLLVTGPTGSGKSTTLYSCLQLLNDSETNICTVEDPVEYKFKGINQIQVRTQVGLTFAGALRSFLRQDPDIIMVGEVRDQETAEICLRAALTGHLVLSTLHTNDALSAVSRLQDMHVEPFLLGSTLRVLQAQRLLPRLCAECKQGFACDAQTAERFGFEPGQTLYHSTGCDACRQTGYRGRVGVFEVIPIARQMGQMIQAGAPLEELRELSREQGLMTLFDSALQKVRDGISSLEIALSVRGSVE